MARSAAPGATRTAGLGSRRYLGCKSALLGFLTGAIREVAGPPRSVLDLFAGTGVVGAAFNAPDRPVLAVDLLEANRVCLSAFLADEPLDPRALERGLETLNELEPREGYVSATYGDLFFTPEHAARIDAARDWIEASGPEGRLRDCLVASVLLGADRVARTCGHYDAYRRDAELPPELVFPHLELPEPGTNRGNRVLLGRAEELASRLPCDLAYLDPPYNSRQYADLYHLLENLARWEKPPVEGKARKMDRSGLKSRFNLKDAPEAFREVVRGLRCRWIAVSYSNMGDKGDPRSQARIPDAAILAALEERGAVQTFHRDHKPFSAGRGRIPEHRERLFLCEVTR